MAGISNIIEIKRKAIINNLKKSELLASNRAINSLNLGGSFKSKTKSTADLQQSIIKAKERITSTKLISEYIDNKDLIAYASKDSNLRNPEFIFEKEKYNPAIMHIQFTPAKGKTIDKNSDAFLD